MKKFILLLFIAPFFLHAEEDLKRVLQIYRSDTKVDNTLKSNESVYTFKFNDVDYFERPLSVLYSIDGENGKQRMEKQSITIKTTPGKHIFQFYYSRHYYEVYTDSLDIKAKHHNTYQVQLFQAAKMQMEEKPVIYLYPEETTEVRVKLDIHGENPFYYPAYNNGWNVAASPNGELRFDDKVYNYLFWEAQSRTILTPKQTASGFFVTGKDAVSFLEEKLTLAGLNSKEQADFITYWGPRLAQNKLNFIHFEFNESCNEYANLEISPTPDNLYRIFMIWGSVTEEFQTTEQTIEPFDRTGFSVLEWGGKESHIRQSFYNK
ncbi:MAG: hypothetical protein AB8B56_04080 [Crocinitomicaceae bacterium]